MQQNKLDFKLLLRTKSFSIPSDFQFLNDMNQDIYSELITKMEYKIKSNVRNKILRSFIKYLVHREIPDINIDNINEYDLLSQEFDVMKNLVKIIKNSISKNTFSLLISKNQDLKNSIQINKDKQNQKSKKYQQIIKILFNNHVFDTYSNFYKYKAELIDECERQNVDFVNYLTQKKVEDNGLLYILNETEKTAGVFRNFSDEKNLLIPKSIFYESQEYLITKIAAKAFQYDGYIESIQFSEDSELKTIEEFSFAKCTNLASISIPSTVTQIGNYAFNYCLNLSNVTFSEKSELRAIDSFAFSSIKAIESITIPSKVVELKSSFLCQLDNLIDIKIMPDNHNFIYYDDKFVLGKMSEFSENFDVLLYARSNIETAIIPSFVKVIASYSFYDCQKLQNVSFSENSELISIERCAFSNSSLVSISLPPHLNKISNNCFSYCKSLNHIEFSKNSELKTIKKSSFAGTPLTNISIPSSVIEIGEFTFSYCQEIESVDFDENSELRVINDSLFYDSLIKRFTIPSKVVELKDGWCAHSYNLVDIKVMPDNKNFIYFDDKFLLGKSDASKEKFDVLLFSRRDIEVANIPSFIKFISPYAFEFCMKLQKVNFPEDSELISIGEFAFSNATIEMISIPSNLTTIEEYTFFNCYNLKKVTFSIDSKLKVIKQHAFCDSSIETICIPSGVIKIEENAFSYCKNLQSVEFSPDSKLNSIESDSFSHTSINRILIPKKVTHIYDSFQRCNQLINIEFYENSELKVIDKYAFNQSQFESFSIPSNLIELNEGWCCGNKNLTQIKINKNNKNFIYYENKFLLGKSVQTSDKFDVLLFARRDLKKVLIPSFIRKISSFAFEECQNLNIVRFQEKSSLTNIGSSAFSYLPIERIDIPSQVAHIDEFAFSDCHHLRKVFFSEDSKLKKICNYAFRSLPLRSIVIPAHLIQIENFTFEFCKDFQIVEIDENSMLKSIQIETFRGSKNVVIMIPTKSKILIE